MCSFEKIKKMLKPTIEQNRTFSFNFSQIVACNIKGTVFCSKYINYMKIHDVKNKQQTLIIRPI